MLAVILLFVFGGYKLDQWLEWKFPLFTVLGSITGVGMSIYIAVKDLLRKK
ncbi:MAG: ATPase F0F1, partial [Bacteroidetes bacterium HGW-Bacteroidetes-22]